jgi:hypothetical protein
MADHDDGVVVDGDERVLREREPLVCDIAGCTVGCERFPIPV